MKILDYNNYKRNIMLKRYLLYGICGCLLALGGCNRDDEDVHPSYSDTNWFVIPDKPGEFNQLVYQIYLDTGIPIFVNDTLGEEYYARDAAGNPLLRTENFNINYRLFGDISFSQVAAGNTTRYVVQSADTAAMIRAAEMLRDKVIPNLPKSGSARPKCFFVVDSLNDVRQIQVLYNTRYMQPDKNIAAYKAMKGMVMGQLCDILSMTDEEAAVWANKAIAIQVSEWIMDNYKEEIKDWYAITEEDAPMDPVTWGSKIYDMGFKEGHYVYSSDPMTDFGMFGWAMETVDTTGGANVPMRVTYSQEGDICEYVARVYSYRGREEQFRQEYAAYDRVIRKFDIILSYVEEYERLNF